MRHSRVITQRLARHADEFDPQQRMVVEEAQQDGNKREQVHIMKLGGGIAQHQMPVFTWRDILAEFDQK